MDLDALRTVVAVADHGQFQEAAVELSVTQQAVSKRVAALEAELGVRLFTRTARGARLTIDGQAFLPHARAVLAAVARAAESVRPGLRALRVDVLGRRMAPADLLQRFHRAQPDLELDVVTLLDETAAIEAVLDGTIDATFRTGRAAWPAGVTGMRVLDEPLELLTGPAHELATAPRVTPETLARHRIWMPGLIPGTEWAAYYDELAAAFGLRIDATGPNFGLEHVLDMVGDSPALCTFVGARTRIAWTTRQDLRRVPLHDPAPVYPHSLIWRTGNTHPTLAVLRAHLAREPVDQPGSGTWTPSWVQSDGTSTNVEDRP